MEERRKNNWSILGEVVKAGSKDPCMVVQVMKSDHYPFPRYRVKVGFRDSKGFVHGSVDVRVKDQNVLTPSTDSTLEDLKDLLEGARETILTDATYEASTYVEEREKKDLKAAGLGQKVRVTGKTEKKRQKMAGAQRT
jgi:hypothetical protein